MALLTREQILGAKDLKTETVAVPEWGGDVTVRMMTGKERDDFDMFFLRERGADGFRVGNVRARLVSMVVVDDAGRRLFSEEDIETLGGKSATALDRVFTAAQRLNALEPRDVEALGKASSNGQTGSLSSA